MENKELIQANRNTKMTWIRFVIIALVIEKIIQHTVVTIAFYYNFKDIRATVAADPMALMIAGAGIMLLFILCLWGMVKRKQWGINLTAALALVDIIGEFYAQGKVDILITVSFLVAILLFILALVERKRGMIHLSN
jgi:hypothetical protein